MLPRALFATLNEFYQSTRARSFSAANGTSAYLDQLKEALLVSRCAQSKQFAIRWPLNDRRRIRFKRRRPDRFFIRLSNQSNFPSGGITIYFEVLHGYKRFCCIRYTARTNSGILQYIIFVYTNHVCDFITLNYTSMTHCVGIY